MGDDDVIFEAAKVSAPAVREAAGASSPCRDLPTWRTPVVLWLWATSCPLCKSGRKIIGHS